MSFTWFDKFSEAIAKIPDQGDKDTFKIAIVDYGMTGIEPELPYPLDALFAICKEDIDNSVKARNSNTGGRPKKTKSEEPTPEPEVTEEVISEDKNPTEKPHLKTPPKNPTQKPNTEQYSTEQYKAEQNKREKAQKMRPPTPEEVEEYARGQDETINAAEFCDYYAAQGWRLSNGNAMKDWRAAARRWIRSEKGGTHGSSGEFAAYA
jgi:outer membrane biosynthesis protein TonB